MARNAPSTQSLIFRARTLAREANRLRGEVSAAIGRSKELRRRLDGNSIETLVNEDPEVQRSPGLLQS